MLFPQLFAIVIDVGAVAIMEGLLIIIMGIFKCNFFREHIALSLKKCVNVKLGK